MPITSLRLTECQLISAKQMSAATTTSVNILEHYHAAHLLMIHCLVDFTTLLMVVGITYFGLGRAKEVSYLTCNCNAASAAALADRLHTVNDSVQSTHSHAYCSIHRFASCL